MSAVIFVLYWFCVEQLSGVNVEDTFSFLNSTNIGVSRNINMFVSSLRLPEYMYESAAAIYNDELHIIGGFGFQDLSNILWHKNTYHLKLSESNILTQSDSFTTPSPTTPRSPPTTPLNNTNATNIFHTTYASVAPFTTAHFNTTFSNNNEWEIKYNNVPFNNNKEAEGFGQFGCFGQLSTSIRNKLYVITGFLTHTNGTKPHFYPEINTSNSAFGYLHKYLLIFDMETKQYIDMSEYSSIMPGGVNMLPWGLFVIDLYQCLTHNTTHLFVVGIDSLLGWYSTLIYDIQNDEWSRGSDALLATYMPSCFYLKATQSVYMYQGVDVVNNFSLVAGPNTPLSVVQKYDIMDDKWSILPNNISFHTGYAAKSILFEWDTFSYIISLGSWIGILHNIYGRNITEFAIYDSNNDISDGFAPKYYSIPYTCTNKSSRNSQMKKSRIETVFEIGPNPVVKYLNKYVLILGGRSKNEKYLKNIMVLNISINGDLPTYNPTMHPTISPTSKQPTISPVDDGSVGTVATLFSTETLGKDIINDTEYDMILYLSIGGGICVLIIVIFCIFYWMKYRAKQRQKTESKNDSLPNVSAHNIQLMNVVSESSSKHMNIVTPKGDNKNPNIEKDDIIIDGDSDDNENNINAPQNERLLSHRMDIVQTVEGEGDNIVIDTKGMIETIGNDIDYGVKHDEFVVDNENDIDTPQGYARYTNNAVAIDLNADDNVITIGDLDQNNKDNTYNQDINEHLETIM